MELENKNIVFMHIPKNGGTTLDSILDKNFDKQDIFNVKVINNNELNISDLLKLGKEELDKIKLLKGHVPFGIHNKLNKDYKYITLLRNPVERIISFYYYVLSLPNHRLHLTVKKQNMSLYDFTTQINQGDVNNAQIRVISGIEDTTENMLAKALENIEKNFSFVGLVERYDESLVLLQELYKFKIPYYRSLNKTPKRAKLNKIDVKTLEAIKTLNHGDIDLYTIMEKKFSSELQNIDLLNLKLKKLRTLNKLYNFYSDFKS